MGMLKDWAKRVVARATLVAASLTLAATRFALAQGGATPVSLVNPIAISTLQGVTASISNFLLLIAIPLTAIMALVGGFQMITAAGSPEKFANGRKTLMYAAIGFAVVLIAGGVASIIQNFIGG